MKSSLLKIKTLLLGSVFSVAVAVQPLVVSAPAMAKDHSSETTVCEELIHGRQFCVTRTVVRARPEAVWQVLTDYANAPKVFKNLRKCQVVEDKGATKILRHQVAPTGLPGTYEYIVELKEVPNKSMEWHRLSGSFKDVDGYWKLEPIDGGRSTEVTYSAYVNGGLFLPQPLVRRQFHIDMPGVMTALKTQAEGATQIAGRPVSRVE